METTRENFIAFVKENNLFDNSKPVTGHEISVMQFIGDDGLLKAYSKYTKVQGSPCIVSYVICDIEEINHV